MRFFIKIARPKKNLHKTPPYFFCITSFRAFFIKLIFFKSNLEGINRLPNPIPNHSKNILDLVHLSSNDIIKNIILDDKNVKYKIYQLYYKIYIVFMSYSRHNVFLFGNGLCVDLGGRLFHLTPSQNLLKKPFMWE